MMADGENLTVCPVCSRDYQTEGKHVPRILACFHTVCEGCIKGKLDTERIFQCPQYGTKHSAENGIENFQENKYILRHMKKMADRTPEKKRRNRRRETGMQKAWKRTESIL